jgi:osmotically-inducible protein OsmY
MAQHGVSRDVAEKLMHKSDHEREGFLRYAFHMDWNDPSLYDLVVNTGKVGTDGAAALIAEAARSEEIRECSIRALDTMARLSLGKRVQAELLRNNFDLALLSIEVADQGLVHLGGVMKTEEKKKRLTDVVRKVPGVSDVQSGIIVMPKAAL